MVKRINTQTEERMSRETKKKIIEERQIKDILFQDDLKGKIIFYNEDEIQTDGTFDLVYYYIDKKTDPKDPETIIWRDKYSSRKTRENSIEEFKRRRQRA